MRTNEQQLQDIVRLAQTGRDFFASVGPGAAETEVRAAFAYVADVKARLIHSLATWASPSMAEATGPVSVGEKLYNEARQNFRFDAPATAAPVLTQAEDQLLRLVECAFEATRVPALRQLLKSFYSEVAICRQAMARLQSRLAA
jgi:hypothetical protein